MANMGARTANRSNMGAQTWGRTRGGGGREKLGGVRGWEGVRGWQRGRGLGGREVGWGVWASAGSDVSGAEGVPNRAI